MCFLSALCCGLNHDEVTYKLHKKKKIQKVEKLVGQIDIFLHINKENLVGRKVAESTGRFTRSGLQL